MIIKRYLVDSMNEAMIKIRYELGNDAVIVSQRRIRQKGLLGLIKSKRIEVTAAVDDKPKKSKAEEENTAVKNELAELKTMLQGVLSQNKAPSPRKDTRNKFKLQLMENDIPEDIIEDIYNNIKEKYKDKKLTNSIYEKELSSTLAEMIKTDSGFSCRIQVLVGPTGVGKTTTIAKLASLYTLYKGKKVGLITIDTYRIGAVEQLKTYADILGVPFEVVISSKEMTKAIKKMEGCDVIFIDTTGRNSKNIMQISEIRNFINEVAPDKIHLVLSMTTKQKDIKSIIENYRMISYNSMILTKVDETDTYGSMLTAVYYGRVPVAYLSTGQNVPDDIEEMKADKISKLIMEAGQ